MRIISRPLVAIGSVILFAGLGACVAPKTEAPEPAVTPPVPTPPAPPAKDIWTAAGEADIVALEAHKEAGTDLDGLHPDAGVTPLVIALGAAQQSAVMWLLNNGADANATNLDGGGALHAAAFIGNSRAAGLLLERGADPEMRNDNGASVRDILELDWATTAYIAQLIQLELDQQTVESGRAAIMAMLEGGSANAGDAGIWQATVAGDSDAVRSEIRGGADVNAFSPDGAPLLLVAAFLGHVDVVSALVDADAQIDARHTGNGSTALHAAAFLGHADVVNLLIDKGADTSALSGDGLTARQVAQIDWPTTEYIASMLQVEVDREEVMGGRTEVMALLTE